MSNEEQPPAQPSVPPVPRPAPQYGEYADPAAPPPVPAPVTPAPAYQGYAEATQQYGVYSQPPVKKRRTWDMVLTIILLVLGLFGMTFGLFYAWILADPELLRESFATQGYEWNGTTGSASLVIAVSHVLLYLLVLGLSIPLLIKGKIVVFWIPLAAGVIAAIIFWVALYSVVLSDPNFVNQVPGA
jgi:hypothetical protein